MNNRKAKVKCLKTCTRFEIYKYNRTKRCEIRTRFLSKKARRSSNAGRTRARDFPFPIRAKSRRKKLELGLGWRRSTCPTYEGAASPPDLPLSRSTTPRLERGGEPKHSRVILEPTIPIPIPSSTREKKR